MEVLNYTGKDIGVFTKTGIPIAVLLSKGSPKCHYSIELGIETDKLIPIWDKQLLKVTGLPAPDPNLKTYYVVTKEVADAVGSTRFDLLLATEPVEYEGVTYYKKLIMV